MTSNILRRKRALDVLQGTPKSSKPFLFVEGKSDLSILSGLKGSDDFQILAPEIMHHVRTSNKRIVIRSVIQTRDQGWDAYGLVDMDADEDGSHLLRLIDEENGTIGMSKLAIIDSRTSACLFSMLIERTIGWLEISSHHPVPPDHPACKQVLLSRWKKQIKTILQTSRFRSFVHREKQLEAMGSKQKSVLFDELYATSKRSGGWGSYDIWKKFAKEHRECRAPISDHAFSATVTDWVCNEVPFASFVPDPAYLQRKIEQRYTDWLLSRVEEHGLEISYDSGTLRFDQYTGV